ncbi:MAG: hypothetical protein DI570_23400 [Phenylobacterium zucineum]|nr:MAG: hypothetical protein DI570_23400 [Phenylobacterium zucineum]
MEPPLPELTNFERQALRDIAALFESEADDFLGQVASARVVDRVNTGVGFYTRVIVDRSLCKPLPVRAKGGHFEVEGLSLGLGVVLWDDEGYLRTIEGYTYEESPLEARNLSGLKYCRLVQLG